MSERGSDATDQSEGRPENGLSDPETAGSFKHIQYIIDHSIADAQGSHDIGRAEVSAAFGAKVIASDKANENIAVGNAPHQVTNQQADNPFFHSKRIIAFMRDIIKEKEEIMLITSDRSKTFRRLMAIRKRPKIEKKLLLEGEAMRRQLEDFCIPYTLYAKEGEEVDSEVFLRAELFDRLVSTVTPQPFLLVVDIPEKRPFDEGAILVLDRIRDPGNLGTILRSAAGFGINNILSLKGSVSWTNTKVLRSSLGSILSLVIHEDGSQEDLMRIKKAGYRLIGADMYGEDVRTFSAPEKWALMIGNEGKGLSKALEPLLDDKLSIPMKGEMESLNAAVAASILLFCMTMNKEYK